MQGRHSTFGWHLLYEAPDAQNRLIFWRQAKLAAIYLDVVLSDRRPGTPHSAWRLRKAQHDILHFDRTKIFVSTGMIIFRSAKCGSWKCRGCRGSG